MRSGHQSLGGIAASPASLTNKRFTLPFLALLAVLTAGLLFLLPGGLLQAQEDGTIDYAENGMDPVATYTGLDPEGRPVYWSLLEAINPIAAEQIDGVVLQGTDIVDHEDFTISSDGVLSFKFSPDYEMPEGTAFRAASTGKTNTYKIVVVASDDAFGVMGRGMTHKTVTVTVTDVDEGGSISLSAQQPQVDVALTATLTDQDARSGNSPIIDAKWKWEQAQAMNGPWSLISGAGANATPADTSPDPDIKASDGYEPAADTADKYLRATVTYTDKHGEDKTAMAVSAHAVRAVPSGTNSDPAFPDSANTREVDENSPPGTPVGDPVKANDTPGEILTYGLRGTDAGNYTIDATTGQLRVGARGLEDADTGQAEPSNTVTVWAMDPSSVALEATPTADADDENNGRHSVDVTITIKNVNEAPMVSDGLTKTSLAEDRELVIDVYMATDVESTEGGDPCDETTDQVSVCTWILEGDDASLFEISNAAAEVNGRLSFKNAPDFENPADADMDNVYMVTVKVTDNGVANKNKMSATRDVMVTITNADDPGTITFSTVQPKARIPFTATLTDEDGILGEVKWQWHNAEDGESKTDLNAIAKATMDTYTPKAATDDNDEAIRLSVVAKYTDSSGSDKTVIDTAENDVAENRDNAPPEFKEGGDKPVTRATRDIAENSPDPDADPVKTSNVESPVTATDPNAGPDGAADPEGRLTYTLGGRDKDSFAIVSATGQITVKAGTKLDYEGPKKSYMVTVTATDPSQASTTIDVTINVTNEDESPVIVGEDVKKDYAENGTSAVARFMARDPEGRTVYWSLSEDASVSPDSGEFKIRSNGELRFSSPPDYDAPDDEGINNVYVVTVVASDDAPGADGDAGAVSGKISTKQATITVTDRNETGTLTLLPRFPDAGDPLNATLADEDATEAQILGATWTWYVNGSLVPGANTANHTPANEAVGSVRVEARYRDGHGESAKMLSASVTVIAVVSPNADPEFTEGETTTRKVSENRHPATVGSPVRATDADRAHSGRLLYSVETTDANFTVDPTMGQLRTKAALDHEEAAEGTVTITVTVTDPAGTTDSITVTVTVTDVNEDPTINDGLTMKVLNEDDVDTTDGDTELKVGETYMATDPESTGTDNACNAESCTWSVRGADAADFTIGDGDEGTTFGALMFKEFPNYEKPADSNKDNTYMVTVVLTDKGGKTATRDVTVVVKDVEEDGIVTLSSVQPKVGLPVKAELKDPDGGVENETWKWHKAADADSVGDDWTLIDDATSDTYTPVSADATPPGMFLRATASYNDRRDEGKTAMDVSDNAVIVNNDNVAPVFKENDQEITETTKKVKENAKPNVADGSDDGPTQGNVGDKVTAEDPNGADLLTYKLTGMDAGLFKVTNDAVDDETIIRGGQIHLNAGTKLDRETKDTYMVKVTATDPNGLSDSVDVTIKVTDVDEAPEIITGGLVVTGTSDINYAENGMAMVATYSAAGPDAAGATWRLSGADEGDFEISSAGVLTFMASPDYESPADANTDNIYMVMVNANDGTNNAMKTVSVRVTNEEEMGEVTLWAGADALTVAPQVGDTITGAVMDPDGGETVESWQWARTMDTADMSSWMDIQDATNAAYMVTAGDAGYHLRVMATYTDAVGTDTAMVDSMPTMMVTAMMTVPMFDSETDTRDVAENTAASMDIGDPVMGTDADGDTLIYTLGGTDAGSFYIDPETGQLKTLAALDYETKATYSVMVTATDPDSASDMITVTITVTNEDEMGMVTLWAGMDALTMAPQVGDTITGAVMDPDGGETVESWQWARTMDTADMSSWMDIQGATNAAYTVMEGDTGYHLRVMATYTDAAGTDMAMVYSMPTMMVTEMMGEVTLWDGMVALTMAPQVGDTITGAVMDPDVPVNVTAWQWAKTMDTADMNSWTDIQGATNAAYMVTEGDAGYHLRVMATYTDAAGTDMAMVYSMPTSAAAGGYDADNSGTISKLEALAAVSDYFDGNISKLEALAVIASYFDDRDN